MWYGSKQGLVSRRTALRQAESLKGHGFSVGKSIVGRNIKDLKELNTLLNKGFKNLDDYTVTFDVDGEFPSAVKPKSKSLPPEESIPEPVTRPAPKPEPVEVMAQPIPVKKEMKFASEYDTEPDLPKESTPIKSQSTTVTPMSTLEHSTAPSPKLELSIQAKIGFVIIGVLDHYDDVWISKKENSAYSVEHMDGKICEFSIFEGKIKFSSDSFSGISTNVKTEIQKKFVELSKLL